ncbi:MAG: transposase, partial [Gemmataceae bacterium]
MDPVTYFITWTTYGTWLHGREAGSVDRHHNALGTRFLPANISREEAMRAALRQPPYFLDEPRREIVLQTI